MLKASDINSLARLDCFDAGYNDFAVLFVGLFIYLFIVSLLFLLLIVGRILAGLGRILFLAER